MLDQVVAFTSAFMLVLAHLGRWHLLPGEGHVLKIAEYTSNLREGIDSITITGQCLHDGRVVPCHTMIAACKLHCLVKYTPYFTAFFAIALLSCVFAAITKHALDRTVSSGKEAGRGIKELTWFTAFLLGFATLTGCAASGFGIAFLFAPFSARIPLRDSVEVYVGWAELLALTVCLGFMTVAFINHARASLGGIRGRLALADSAEAQALLEAVEADDKGKAGTTTS